MPACASSIFVVSRCRRIGHGGLLFVPAQATRCRRDSGSMTNGHGQQTHVVRPLVVHPLSRWRGRGSLARRDVPEAGSRHDGFPTPRNHENVSYALPFAVCPLPRNGVGGWGEGAPPRTERTLPSPGRPARSAGRAAGGGRTEGDVHLLPLPSPPRSGAGVKGSTREARWSAKAHFRSKGARG